MRDSEPLLADVKIPPTFNFGSLTDTSLTTSLVGCRSGSCGKVVGEPLSTDGINPLSNAVC